jgi:hypothetical protein
MASRSRSKHTNLAVQLHLHPSGKAGANRARRSYFAKRPPEVLTGIRASGVRWAGIDIPAGEANYTIKDSFVLPVDVESYGTRGHAHYLAAR